MRGWRIASGYRNVADNFFTTADERIGLDIEQF